MCDDIAPRSPNLDPGLKAIGSTWSPADGSTSQIAASENLHYVRCRRCRI
jgi:hypothetical protein